MPDNIIKIEVKGLDKLMSKLNRFQEELPDLLKRAGQEASKEIIETQGLQQYPPETAANRPPPPYYIRGVGTQFFNHNRFNSERYGTRFFTRSEGFNTTIGNSASYARFLTGLNTQSPAMAQKGWRKLFDVAMEKIGRITEIYQKWVNFGLKKSGL